MSKHAYLVLAHNRLSQLKSLLRLIDDRRNDIYLLIDQKSVLKNEDLFDVCQYARLHFVNRMSVSWGGLSLIRAELLLLEAAIGGNYAYYHLLSGQDLPLRTQDELHAFFDGRSDEFVCIDRHNDDTAEWKTRYHHWFVDGYNYSKKRRYKFARILLMRIQQVVGYHRKRRYEKYYHGSAWFSVTHALASYIVGLKAEIDVEYRNTICCDEVFLQTEVMHSPFSQKVYSGVESNRANLRLVDWRRRVGNSPHTWRLADFDALQNTECLFARKFDEFVDAEIISKWENHLRLRAG